MSLASAACLGSLPSLGGGGCGRRRGCGGAAATGAVGGLAVLLALGPEALEEDGGGLVVRVLGDELAAEGFGEDGAIQIAD
ncbi:hypothetical protein BE11_39130 [Sorangium cellulosum]|nr:hypothetical protein BE11_39130 [Sorangium cellulosum]